MIRSFKEVAAVSIGLGMAASLAACSTVYPLKSVAYRASDPRSLDQDVAIDVSSHEATALRKLAWAAYSATFECPKNCPYTVNERTRLAREVAETSFSAIDRELRHSLGAEHDLADPAATAARAEFVHEVKTDSFKKTVSRWLTKVGLAAAPEVVATAVGLKAIDPSELGWSGGRSLSDLGTLLGMDGILVGHIRISVSEDQDEPRRLVIQGPQLWLYSTDTGKAAARAGLRPTWRLDPLAPADPQAASAVSKLDPRRELRSSTPETLDWRGFDAVASGMSARMAQALGVD